MRRAAIITLIACGAGLGCDRGRADAPSPATASATTLAPDAAHAQRAPLALDAPAARPVRPLALMRAALKAAHIGAFTAKDATQVLPVRAIGASLCHDGVALQVLYAARDAPDAPWQHTPALALPLKGLVVGTYEVEDARQAGAKVQLTLTHSDDTRLAGEVTVAGVDGAFHASFDGPPQPVLPEAELGKLGCFTTGRYVLRAGSQQLSGPVHSARVADAMYVMDMLIDATRSIRVAARAPAHLHGSGLNLEVTLAQALAHPNAHEARLFFVTRGVAEPLVPSPEGTLSLKSPGPLPKHPLTASLREVRWPEAWSDLKGSFNLEARAAFSADPAGAIIPAPPR